MEGFSLLLFFLALSPSAPMGIGAHLHLPRGALWVEHGEFIQPGVLQLQGLEIAVTTQRELVCLQNSSSRVSKCILNLFLGKMLLKRISLKSSSPLFQFRWVLFWQCMLVLSLAFALKKCFP